MLYPGWQMADSEQQMAEGNHQLPAISHRPSRGRAWERLQDRSGPSTLRVSTSSAQELEEVGATLPGTPGLQAWGAVSHPVLSLPPSGV